MVIKKQLLRAVMATAATAMTAPVLATAYIVTSGGDTTAEDGVTTLREAIAASNSDAAVGTTVPAGTADNDVITIAVSEVILTQGELPIIGDVTITGAATIIASPDARIFNITTDSANPVALSGITLTGGAPLAANVNGNGGAVLVGAGAAVTMTGVTLEGNRSPADEAGEGGGAIFNAGTLTLDGVTVDDNGVTGAAGNGGGVMNAATGTLTITNGAITENFAGRAGGGIENAGGTVTITGLNLSDNTVGGMPGNGGGLHSGGGTVTYNGGMITNNVAAREGGGFWTNGTATIDGTTISGNEGQGADATQGGGGIFIDPGAGSAQLTVLNATITGNSATGTSGSGGGIFNEGGELTVTDTTISNNTANRAGGAIEDNSASGATVVTITNAVMDGNTAGSNPGNGGAIHVSGADGEMTISGSMFTNNIADREGGALWAGGAGTVMNVSDSTLDNNEAKGPAADDGGGGLFINGGEFNGSAVTITNNSATGASGSGGGIHNLAGTLTLGDASVVSNNIANRAGGGLEDAGAAVTIINDSTMNNNNVGVAPAVAAPGNGGAIHVSGGVAVMEIDASTFDGNMAAAEGGAIWAGGTGTTMLITGSSITNNIVGGTDAGNGGGGVFLNGGALIISEFTEITGNAANGATNTSGGGILNHTGMLTVEDTIINNNSATRAGGAIEDDARANAANGGASGTTTVLTRVTMTGNSTGGAPGNGGAVHISGGSGNVTIDSSEISENTADNEGGGIWAFNGSTMAVVNSTISGNQSPIGGGVFSQQSEAITLTNVTVASNGGGNGIAARVVTDGNGTVTASGTVIVVNSIVANNSPADSSGNIRATNSVFGTLPATLDAASANNVTANPNLVALALNGSDRRTHAIPGSAATSPALDFAMSDANCPDVDQRGDTRAAGECDAGAYEFTDNPSLTAVSTVDDAAQTSARGDSIEAVGFTLSNDSTEAVNVSGFRGELRNSLNLTRDIDDVIVYLDAGTIGELDGGDVALADAGGTAMAAGDVIVSAATNSFAVAFDTDRSVAAGSTESYLVVVQFSPDGAPGGVWFLPLALGLLLVRRLRAVGATALVVLGLSACGGSSVSTAGFDNNSIQMNVTSVQARGATSGGSGITASLPANGRVITLQK